METEHKQIDRPVFTADDLRLLAQRLADWSSQAHFVVSMEHRLMKFEPMEALDAFMRLHFGVFDETFMWEPLRNMPKHINDQKHWSNNISRRAAIAKWRLEIAK